MSAAVCGSKRSFFEDIPSSPSASVSKKLRRCSPSSPSSVRFAPLPSLLDHLQPLFPHMDPELLERALLECGNNIDTAIKRLQELHLGAADGTGEKMGPVEELGTTAEQGTVTNNGEAADTTAQIPSAPETLPVDDAEWVDLFVGEMMGASSVDDAKARAFKLLEVLEKSISENVAKEAAQIFHKENMMLKEQIQVLIQENMVLKRAVAIQHERQKEYQDKDNELEHLKQLVSQYQDQLRTLEVNNYALTMHLRQAQQSNSIPGRFHPDIF
ncbi:Ubiquitin system component Cue [Gossypium australe]|uniref:Ubiquitin system component Cue n=1 Tax=Gossypium australe TaxID=47621 RepID=A0A5B6WVS7_9ROSI|nr:Ubiquitin system component Cue [Gossypium australe]